MLIGFAFSPGVYLCNEGVWRKVINTPIKACMRRRIYFRLNGQK